MTRLVIGVGVALKTAIAAIIAIVSACAVDELLFGEADEFASGDEVSTF